MTKHPLVERYFPEYPQHKLEELAADIKQNNQTLPVITFQQKILDGWNRWRAMRLLGWTAQQIKFVEFKGTEKEALAFVFSLNYYRRHQSSTDLHTMMELMQAAQHAESAPSHRPSSQTKVITNKQIADAAGISERTVQRRKAAKRTTTVTLNEVPTDPFGHQITPAAIPYWRRRDEVNEFVKLAKQLAAKIKKLSKDDPMYRHVALQAMEAKANAIAHDFAESMPYCLCPVCLGKNPENCRLCDSRGLVTQYTFERGVPKEMREAFETQ